MNNPQDNLAAIDGSWTHRLHIDGKLYWDLEYFLPSKLVYPKNVLPSDCRFREDMYYMSLGKLDKAQQYKEKLEVKQRHDRKLRETHHKKH